MFKFVALCDSCAVITTGVKLIWWRGGAPAQLRPRSACRNTWPDLHRAACPAACVRCAVAQVAVTDVLVLLLRCEAHLRMQKR